MQDIIISPIISEKSTKHAALNKFTFRVAKSADKVSIKKQVEEKFNVSVISVATMVVKGKVRRFGNKRNEVKLPSWKKAIVELKVGQKINMFDIAQGSA